MTPPGIKHFKTEICHTALQFCFQNQLAPLQPGFHVGRGAAGVGPTVLTKGVFYKNIGVFKANSRL
jgi:hypothetical protein